MWVSNRFVLFYVEGSGPDWEYYEISAVLNVSFVPHGDGLYELVALVRPISITLWP